MDISFTSLEHAGYRKFPATHKNNPWCLGGWQKWIRVEGCFGNFLRSYNYGDKKYAINVYLYDWSDRQVQEAYAWEAESTLYLPIGAPMNAFFHITLNKSPLMSVQDVEAFFEKAWKSMNCVLDPHNN